MIAAFESFDYVVPPSGSCAGMIKTHYPELFAGEPDWAGRVERFCAKVFELTAFLVDVRGVSAVDAAYPGTVTYHAVDLYAPEVDPVEVRDRIVGIAA